MHERRRVRQDRSEGSHTMKGLSLSISEVRCGRKKSRSVLQEAAAAFMETDGPMNGLHGVEDQSL